MLRIAKFTFNPFQENTYVVHNGNEAIVFDPGCWNAAEEQELETYFEENGVKPVRLVLTHAHIDHILGCAWIHKQYGLLPEMHKADIPTLKSGERTSSMYGISYNVSPDPEKFLAAGIR